MLFDRDRAVFERELPQWSVDTIAPMMPVRYLLSGGVSLRSLTPGWSTPFWRRLEKLMDPQADRTAMFARIVLTRLAENRSSSRA